MRIYASRGSIPTEKWVSLIDGAQERIDILAFAGSFLHDALPNFVERLKDRAAAGVQVSLLVGARFTGCRRPRRRRGDR